MKLLADEIMKKKHNGNVALFLRNTDIDEDVKQISRWIKQGCYCGKFNGEFSIIKVKAVARVKK
jgi:hypothetical protein